MRVALVSACVAHVAALAPTSHGKFNDFIAQVGRKRRAHGFDSAAAVSGGEGEVAMMEHGPKPAGWFGDFDQAESTYDPEGLDAEQIASGATVDHGWQVGSRHATWKQERQPAEWFDETPSAGGQDAWQTHPGAGATAAQRSGGNPWSLTDAGWDQDYVPVPDAETKDARWFDSSVGQYDRYGRSPLPDKGADRRFLDTSGGAWREGAVTAPIACAERGCTANVTLQVFDPVGVDAEEAANCRVTIQVHPTDFDDNWGQEGIEYWAINGYRLGGMCDKRAKAKGCEKEAGRRLYTCVSGVPMDHVLGREGTVLVEGKIGKLVDDCPYEGNLLSGVVTVRCMKRSKPRIQELGEEEGGAFGTLLEVLVHAGVGEDDAHTFVKRMELLGVAGDQAVAMAQAAETLPRGVTAHSLVYDSDLALWSITAEGQPARSLGRQALLLRALTYGVDADVPLRCDSPGCAADAIVNVDPNVAMLGGSCLMNVSVTQTDFDGAETSGEQVDFVSMEGIGNLVTNVSPGSNPCVGQEHGEVMTNRPIFNLVTDMDVTETVLANGATGSMRFRGKISDTVDECASDGSLLDGRISVHCTLPPLATVAALREAGQPILKMDVQEEGGAGAVAAAGEGEDEQVLEE